MLRPLLLLAIIVALAMGVGASAQPANAQEEIDDIAGYWVVWTSGSPCLLFLERDGTDLTGGWACSATGNGQVHGTVAEDNAFNFIVVFQPFENYFLTVDGVLTENRRHLEGSWTFDTDVDEHPPVTGEFGWGETLRSGPRWADMNCDRAVDSLDAYYLLTDEREGCLWQKNRFTQPSRIDNWWAQGGDVNLDGFTDSYDALLILQLDAGLIERLPVLQP